MMIMLQCIFIKHYESKTRQVPVRQPEVSPWDWQLWLPCWRRAVRVGRAGHRVWQVWDGWDGLEGVSPWGEKTRCICLYESGAKIENEGFHVFLLSVKLPSSSCQVQVGHGFDSKLYYWMTYLRLSRWPLVWPIGSWRAGSGTTLSPSSRWNYFFFVLFYFFQGWTLRGRVASSCLASTFPSRLLSFAPGWEFIFQDRLSVVSNWSEWAAHPLSI